MYRQEKMELLPFRISHTHTHATQWIESTKEWTSSTASNIVLFWTKIVWFSIIFFSIFSCKHTISHMNIYWRTIRIGIVTTLESLQWLYYMIDQPTDRPTTFTISIEQCTIHSINLDSPRETYWRNSKETLLSACFVAKKIFRKKTSPWNPFLNPNEIILLNDEEDFLKLKEKSFVGEEMTRKIGQA